jgi:hypothetical protein
MPTIARRIELVVLSVHRLNGGTLGKLDFNYRLLEPTLNLEPFDLAELMIAVERAFHFSLLEAQKPPRTWGDLVVQLQNRRRRLPRKRPPLSTLPP